MTAGIESFAPPKIMILIWNWNAWKMGQQPTDPIDPSSGEYHDALSVHNTANKLLRFDILRTKKLGSQGGTQELLPESEALSYLIQLIKKESKANHPVLVLLHKQDFSIDSRQKLVTQITESSGGCFRIREFGDNKGPVYFSNSDYGLLGVLGLAYSKRGGDGNFITSSLIIDRDRRPVILRDIHFDRIWQLYWHKINHYLTNLRQVFENKVGLGSPKVFPTTLSGFLEGENLLATVADLRALSAVDPDASCGFAGYEDHWERFEATKAAKRLRTLRTVATAALTLQLQTQDEFEQMNLNVLNTLADLQSALPTEEKML